LNFANKQKGKSKLVALLLIETETWLWAGILLLLLVAGFAFFDRLLRKGVYGGDTAGQGHRAGAALSELQTLFNPAHKHVHEERERKHVEHDDSGEPPQK
jgi:hypothetical protein